MLGRAAEPRRASFGEAPEAFDAAVEEPPGGDVVSMFGAEVLVEARVGEPAAARPAVGVDHRAEARPAANRRCPMSPF